MRKYLHVIVACASVVAMPSSAFAQAQGSPPACEALAAAYASIYAPKYSAEWFYLYYTYECPEE